MSQTPNPDSAECFVPTCVRCDKTTSTAPCEHCGTENPIGTLEEANMARKRRQALANPDPTGVFSKTEFDLAAAKGLNAPQPEAQDVWVDVRIYLPKPNIDVLVKAGSDGRQMVRHLEMLPGNIYPHGKRFETISPMWYPGGLPVASTTHWRPLPE